MKYFVSSGDVCARLVPFTHVKSAKLNGAGLVVLSVGDGVVADAAAPCAYTRVAMTANPNARALARTETCILGYPLRNGI